MEYTKESNNVDLVVAPSIVTHEDTQAIEQAMTAYKNAKKSISNTVIETQNIGLLPRTRSVKSQAGKSIKA